MARPPLSVTLITLNEEKNIARAIQSVQWADEILVVDSGSTDQTVTIAQKMGCQVLHNDWKGYGQQKNFAQYHAKNDWILNLDADEEISAELKAEILTQLELLGNQSTQYQGFYIPRKTFYLGRWIHHGGWYPNYLLRLADRRCSRWTEPSVHEELRTSGLTQELENPILHYSFEDIQDQILTNLTYSKQGYEALKGKGKRASLLRLLFKPVGKFIETFILKRGFLDGIPGLIISINAAHSIFLKYAYLIEEELRANTDHRQ